MRLFLAGDMELVERKTPLALKVLPIEGQDWTIHCAFFARKGFTEAALAAGQTRQAMMVDLDGLDAGISA